MSFVRTSSKKTITGQSTTELEYTALLEYATKYDWMNRFIEKVS